MRMIWKVAKSYLTVALLPLAIIIGGDLTFRAFLHLLRMIGTKEVHLEQHNVLGQTPLFVLVVILIAIIFSVRR
jgi:hypothetical protein